MLVYIKEVHYMFKDKLKELRMQKGISQYELAENLFVSRSAIAKWENGNGIPSDVNLEAICEFFNVEEEWLLDRGDIKEVEQLDGFKPVKLKSIPDEDLQAFLHNME